MGEVERIEVRKIYVGRAAIFGLLYGLIIGVLFGIAIILMVLLGVGSALNAFGIPLGLTTSTALIFAFGAVILYAIATCIMAIISAALYNLVAKMGGRIDLGLLEFVKMEDKINIGTSKNQLQVKDSINQEMNYSGY